MLTKAVAWTVAGGLLFGASVKADSLGDLQSRLTALRSDQPIRLLVNVELERRGSAPLHLRKTRLKGMATVISGPNGLKSLEQKWLSSKTELSLWTSSDHGNSSELKLLDEEEAEMLANPADTLEVLLQDATVLSEQATVWEGRPARLLVVRPALFAGKGENPGPLAGEVSIWLDETGEPLALERSSDIGITGLRLTQHQRFTFQKIDGRLLVATAKEHFQGTAIAVLRSKETRTMTVSVGRGSL